MLEIIYAKRKDLGIPMERFYAFFGVSRQYLYQKRKRVQEEQKMMDVITEDVAKFRKQIDDKAGSRTLFYTLKIKSRFNIGVTKFEQLISYYGLTIPKQKKKIRTTQSCVQSYTCPNLTNGLRIDNINQLVVGDITYVRRGFQVYFLFSLIDVYSARIVGHHISTRMRKEEAIEALNMWFDCRGNQQLKGCIHHTDGGGQYFSIPYQGTLKALYIMRSRAQTCLENGYAEQRNYTLKAHLLPLCPAEDLATLRVQLNGAIDSYNIVRKQEKLNWMSPVEYETEMKKRKGRPVKELYYFKENEHSGRV